LFVAISLPCKLRVIELIFEGRALLDGDGVWFARVFLTDHLQVAVGHDMILDICRITYSKQTSSYANYNTFLENDNLNLPRNANPSLLDLEI
jgi:hypothetical protein